MEIIVEKTREDMTSAEALANQVTELENKVKSAEQALTEATEQHKTAVDELTARAEKAEGDLATANDIIEAAKSNTEAMTSELETLRARVAELEPKAEAGDKAQAELETAKTDLEAANGQVVELAGQLKTVVEATEQLKSQVALINEHIKPRGEQPVAEDAAAPAREADEQADPTKSAAYARYQKLSTSSLLADRDAARLLLADKDVKAALAIEFGATEKKEAVAAVVTLSDDEQSVIDRFNADQARIAELNEKSLFLSAKERQELNGLRAQSLRTIRDNPTVFAKRPDALGQ